MRSVVEAIQLGSWGKESCEEASFLNTYMSRREQNILVMDLEEIEARNDCAGEGQQ
jgi:hypothetical protein